MAVAVGVDGRVGAQPVSFVPRVAHLEQDIEIESTTESLLFPRTPRFRWACDLCAAKRRCYHGRWVGRDRADDEADAHDEMHENERRWEQQRRELRR